MLPFIRIGPMLLQLPGLALLAGVWGGSWLAEFEARRLNAAAEPGAPPVPLEALNQLIFYSLAAGLIGARLAYAARYPQAFLANPASLGALTPATLWPEAGLVCGLVCAALVWRVKRLPLRPVLDALAPGLAAFMAGLALAHLLSGDAFGAPAYAPDGVTPLPWAIDLWGERRHPSQVYELLAAAGILAVAWRRPLGQPGQGLNFILVVGLSAMARLALEAFRGDSLMWPGGWRAAQVIALAVLAASLVWLRAWSRPDSGPAAPAEAGH
jgi:prolipoprotein diacylglyceryltransferase